MASSTSSQDEGVEVVVHRPFLKAYLVRASETVCAFEHRRDDRASPDRRVRTDGRSAHPRLGDDLVILLSNTDDLDPKWRRYSVALLDPATGDVRARHALVTP